jgi:hypothetical protein
MDINGGSEMELQALRDRIADLRSRLPKHSVPARMILELEDLEDELARLESLLEETGGQ